VYERAGYDWLERYFNPTGMFKDVYVVSPLETGERHAHGMTIIGVPEDEFAATLRKIRPDVVRAYGAFWPCDLVNRHRVRGIPIVVSVHDVRASLIHPSVQYADLVLCVTRAVEMQVQAAGVHASRIRRLPNRVDTHKFRRVTDPNALAAVAGQFPAGRHILHIGRKSSEKNLDTLIRSLAHLPPEYLCVLVGAGDRTPFVALAEELGVGHRCFWVDAVRNSVLPVWYSWCDCFCVPSRFEGFSLVSLEAAAAGAALVVSGIPALKEWLTHDESACIVDEYENPQALANAIRKVCEDQPYRSALQAGASRVATQFELAAVDQLEASLYREAIGIKPPSLPRRADIAAWRLRASVEARISYLKWRLRRYLSATA
jgi:glycosyltransferase involved in cell wall biosynthesis